MFRNKLSHILLVFFTIIMIFVLSSFYEAQNQITFTELNDYEILGFPPAYLLDSNNIKIFNVIDSYISVANKRNNFHGSVLVAKKNNIVFHKNYGYADLKGKTLINDESAFQLASVSKQFTAAAIMILYERGLINLDDSLTKFFPDLVYSDIKVRHLLNHTSGLPKYFWLAEHKWNKEIAPTNDQVIDLMEEYKLQHFFPAGANFDYSNTGYMVLASIVEVVSGQSFGDFVKENIFDPLDMKNTFVYSCTLDSVRSNQLAGYYKYRGWRYAKIDATVNDGVVGDKNVYSTTKDLFKWITGLNSNKILSKESLDLIYHKGKNKYGREIPYGFGFRLENKDNENVIYHNGKWNGFRTSIKQYPESEITIIILEHTSYSNLNSLIKKVKKQADQIKI